MNQQPLETLIVNEEQTVIREELALLPEYYRRTLTLKEMERITCSDINKMTGTPNASLQPRLEIRKTMRDHT